MTTVIQETRAKLQILTLAIAGVGGMVWAVSKIAAVHQKVDAHDAWLFVFIGFGTIGAGLIIVSAYRAIRDQKEPAHIKEQAKCRGGKRGPTTPRT